jgi:hypothetical protein
VVEERPRKFPSERAVSVPVPSPSVSEERSAVAASKTSHVSSPTSRGPRPRRLGKPFPDWTY